MKKTESSINNRFYIHYKETISYDLILKKNIENLLEIPKLKKIILNTTSKVIVYDKKYIIPGLVALEIISGQKQKITSAHKSISGFKLRENQIIGCKVDLRGELMFHFLEKLITVILPRVRNFRGIFFKFFDGNGNLNLGLSSLLIFPELENYFEYFEFIRGINITLVTSNNKLKPNFFLNRTTLQNFETNKIISNNLKYKKTKTYTSNSVVKSFLNENNKQFIQNKNSSLLLTSFKLAAR
jgi:large subunit ribosomal protein L5